MLSLTSRIFCHLTLLRQVENCQVTANVRTVRRDHTVYHAVQVAASDKPARSTTKQMLGHFRKAGVPPKRIIKEFPVSADAVVPVGELSTFSPLTSPSPQLVLRNNIVRNSFRTRSIC